MVGGGDAARVVCVEEPEVAALAAFYAEAWGQPVSPDTVRRNRATAAAANPATPGRVPPAFLFMTGGRAVGHLGTIPVKLRLGGAESPAHWLKGLMVLPDHQNGPVGFFLLKEATRACATTAMALVVEKAARRLYTAHGFADLGALPNAIALLAPARVLARLDLRAIGLPLPPWMVRLLGAARWPPLAAAGGAVLSAASGLWTVARGGRAGSPSASESALPQRAELDRLWDRMRAAVPAAVVRDGAYLERRYGDRRARDYLAVPVLSRTSGALAALAILRRPRASGDPRLNGIRVAVLADLLYPPASPALGLAAIAGAERAARAAGADALLATASDERLRALLRRRAYVDLPGNVHLMVRVADSGPGAAAGAPPPPLGQWWLTRGDSEADEVF